jgi:hypothetical protein
MIKEIQKDDIGLTYRGQVDAEWDLVQSIYRNNYYIGKKRYFI